MDHPTRLDAQSLRWRFDENQLPFQDTSEVDPTVGIVGQPVAIEAMRFGLESDAPGQNVYVRGVSGTGRMTLVQSLLAELDPRPRRRLDRCYVHNFSQPDRPRLITLPAGEGPRFRRVMRQAAEFIGQRLGEVLDTEAAKSRREALQERAQQTVLAITQPLEKDLHANGLTLVNLQTGPVSRSVIFPLRDGQPLPPDQFRKLIGQGVISEQDAERMEALIRQYSKRLEEVTAEVSAAWQYGLQALQEFVQQEVRAVLNGLLDPVFAQFSIPTVRSFLDEVVGDVLENRLPGTAVENLPDATDIYGVNVIATHEDQKVSPVITENMPSVANLLGSVEPDFVSGGQVVSNFHGIRAGALVRADGGYLVLDARDVLMEPGAWRMLMRALRTRSVEIAPAEPGWPMASMSLKPEPIDIQVRVILLGGSGLYYQLDQVDQDFSDLFKVLADFDSEIERSREGVQQYAGVVARLCNDEQLPHFTAGGVAALAEHGARIAARGGRITARFGRIADITREAAFIARKEGRDQVGREHVEETVRRTRYRASLPSQRFQQLVADGVILLQTTGRTVGQMNGLAVIHAGPLSYGFPARLTATVGAGRAGIIDIEGASALSGSIHTKGFHILGGLLHHLLRSEHPLAFSASIAFEQSYGGIDGDSASGAEFCCLISALTGVPIRQGIAMTGAIDQHGHLQAIGGVNEKIDGYFDACAAAGLDGDQGVIIPRANAGDLMLNPRVVEACRSGQFHVFAVGDICTALEILTGMPAGVADASGAYPDGSLLAMARQRAATFFRMSMSFNRPPEADPV